MDRTEKARFTFLKALVGAAWLDKSVTAELLNTLKTYLRRLNTSDEEVTALKPFLQRTIRDPEAQELVGTFLHWHRTAERWEYGPFGEAMADLSEIDTDDNDDKFLANIRTMNQAFHNGLPDFVGRARTVYEAGGIATSPSKRRLDDLDEFVRSRIMFSVRSKMLDLKVGGGDLSAREVAYVTSLSALLGRIAHADEDFSEEEKVEIASLLKESTNLNAQDIDVIMETIIDDTLRGLDLKAITRTFYNLSTPEQREQLMNCLFLVAGADGHIDPAEVAEIERIAVGLNMSHRDILRAKAAAMDTVNKRIAKG